jgi:hypothetical protein
VSRQTRFGLEKLPKTVKKEFTSKSLRTPTKLEKIKLMK